MATEAAHKEKAAVNQRFLETITDDFPDWLATVAFYKAVHLVEALFATHGAHSPNHTERNRRLKRDHPRILEQFKPLFNISKLVRYSDYSISAADVRAHLIEKRLRAIEHLVDVELAKGRGRRK